MKILIIEDEYNLADAISSMLKSEKYLVDINTNGTDGLNNALSGIYDLIILDVMLPGINGFEILKMLREEKVDTKVIMLTAKSSIDDKMLGFNNGADDYLTKPFYMEELVARVNLCLRRDFSFNEGLLEVGDITLDIKTLNLTCISTGESINIIGKEFQILELLMKNKSQVISKESIFNKVWGYDSNCELNNLEAYISFIRRKLKLISSNVTIKAIRGLGYKLEVSNEKTKD